MEYHSDQDQVLFRYLLGQSSEEEQERIEQGYFADEVLFEQLRMAENDLIDNYVRQALSQSQRELFEKHFLCSEDRRERVEVAEVLFEFVARRPVKQRPSQFVKKRAEQTLFAKLSRSWLPIAAMILLLIFSTWLLIDRARLKAHLNSLAIQRDELEQQRAALQQQLADTDRRNVQLARDLDQATDVAKQGKGDQKSLTESSTRIPAFVLISGLSRGTGTSPKLRIAPAVQFVTLRVVLINDDHKMYRAVINDVDGPQVWQATGLKVPSRGPGRTIDVRVPARMLAEKDYVLTLKGVTDLGTEDPIDEYAFSVLRR